MAAPRASVLLGRASARQVLERLLENVRGGESAVLVVRGEAAFTVSGAGQLGHMRFRGSALLITSA